MGLCVSRHRNSVYFGSQSLAYREQQAYHHDRMDIYAKAKYNKPKEVVKALDGVFTEWAHQQ